MWLCYGCEVEVCEELDSLYVVVFVYLCIELVVWLYLVEGLMVYFGVFGGGVCECVWCV